MFFVNVHCGFHFPRHNLWQSPAVPLAVLTISGNHGLPALSRYGRDGWNGDVESQKGYGSGTETHMIGTLKRGCFC